MKIKYSATSFLWDSPFNRDSIQLFHKLHEMGYDSLEIAVEDPKLIDTRLISQAMKETGMEATVCGAFGPDRDLTHEDKSVRENAKHFIRDCIKIAETIGAPLFTGPMYSAVGKARMVSDDQRRREWDLAVTGLREVCHAAANAGIVLAIEPLNRFETDLVNTSEAVTRMAREIQHPAAKVILDGFHMNIEEVNMEKALIHAKDFLVHIQVSENHRGIPGTGAFDWQSFKRGLQAIDYHGHVVIESFTTDIKQLADAVCFWRTFAPSQDIFARQGLQFLKNLLG